MGKCSILSYFSKSSDSSVLQLAGTSGSCQIVPGYNISLLFLYSLAYAYAFAMRFCNSPFSHAKWLKDSVVYRTVKCFKFQFWQQIVITRNGSVLFWWQGSVSLKIPNVP